MKYYVFFRTDNNLIKIKDVIVIDRFLVFKHKYHKIAGVALKSTLSFTFEGVESYLVKEHQTTTFNFEHEILDESHKIAFLKFLQEQPELCHITQKLDPENIPPHLINEEMLRIFVNQQFIPSMLKKLEKHKSDIALFAFVGGVGFAFILMLIISALFPDSISFKLGG